MVDVRIVRRAGEGNTQLGEARLSQVPAVGEYVDIDLGDGVDYREVLAVYWTIQDENQYATVLVAREQELLEVD